MGQWCVYLLRCADNTLYTGITTDVDKRVRQHNGELVGGAKYTRARRPVNLVWKTDCADRSDASRKELLLKKMNRQKKIQLIAGELTL